MIICKLICCFPTPDRRGRGRGLIGTHPLSLTLSLWERAVTSRDGVLIVMTIICRKRARLGGPPYTSGAYVPVASRTDRALRAEEYSGSGFGVRVSRPQCLGALAVMAAYVSLIISLRSLYLLSRRIGCRRSTRLRPCRDLRSLLGGIGSEHCG